MTYRPPEHSEDERQAWLKSTRQDADTHGATPLFDHASRTPEEICRDQIDLAIRLGWRGHGAEDFRGIRRLMTIAYGDAEPAYLYVGADEVDVATQLDGTAEEARDHIAEQLGEGYAVYDDGEAGATLAARIDMEDDDR